MNIWDIHRPKSCWVYLEYPISLLHPAWSNSGALRLHIQVIQHSNGRIKSLDYSWGWSIVFYPALAYVFHLLPYGTQDLARFSVPRRNKFTYWDGSQVCPGDWRLALRGSCLAANYVACTSTRSSGRVPHRHVKWTALVWFTQHQYQCLEERLHGSPNIPFLYHPPLVPDGKESLTNSSPNIIMEVIAWEKPDHHLARCSLYIS